MADPGLSGLGPRDRRRALRNRAARQRFRDTHPLATLTDREIHQQATGDVRATSMPLVREINQRARAGEANIAGIAGALAQAQGGYGSRIGAIYGNAEQALGQLDEAQRRALGNANGGSSNSTIKEPNTLADELRARTAQAGLGQQGEDLAAALQASTQGAAGAGFARGGAERAALISNRAAEEGFGAKLPELARLAGIQGVQQRGAQRQQELNDLEAKIPSSIAEAIAQERNRNFQKASAQLAYQGNIFSQEQQTGRTAMQQAGANSRTRAQQAGANRRARAANAERARHNRNMEAAGRSEHNRKVKERLERQRHNRAMEKISKGKGLSKKSGGNSGRP